MPYPATPKTWVAGDVLTAAQLNAELRDALLAMFPLGPPDAAWTNFTPTLTQSTTVTKTVTYARYMKIGRFVTFTVNLAVTGAGTAAQQVKVGVPVPAAAGAVGSLVGPGAIYDQSANVNYGSLAYLSSTGDMALMPSSANVSIAQGQTGAPFAVALANLDQVLATGTYEAAT